MEIMQLNHTDVLNILPERKPEIHKGDCGNILLLCGSRGYTGAPALAAMGALRCGAGLVYMAVPESIYPIIAGKLLEPIVLPMPDNDGKFSEDCIPVIEKYIDRMDAVLIGPGMGQSKETQRVTEWVLSNYKGTVVVDADGINVLCQHKDILRERTGVTILTPHCGEFSRLCPNMVGDRNSVAVAAAIDLNAIILLKGHNTVITDGKRTYINPTGNPGMAVGGSGDVLSGVIVALLGMGIPPLEAAACGAWLHGMAGDICCEEIGQYGMLPSDMLQVLPRLLK